MAISKLRTAASGAPIGGHYRIVRLLGAGGMGTVYEAVNTRTGRRVAIKVLAAEYADRPDVLSRFKREARAATQIAHPNIVEVLDLQMDPGHGGMCIVQELLQGEDLRTRLTRVVRMSLGDTLDAIVPVMGALVAAHRCGVIHRDIKPENIFLARGPSGEVPKLIDFGIAKLVDSDPESAGTHATREGTTLGTVQYMSPEQVRGASDVDARTDVWAVGAVLYECLAGVGPFDAPTYNESVARVLTERPPRLEKLAPHVRREFADLVHRALEPDREARTASMRAMLHAVLECDVGEQLVARHKASIPGLEADDANAIERGGDTLDPHAGDPTLREVGGGAVDSEPTTEVATVASPDAPIAAPRTRVERPRAHAAWTAIAWATAVAVLVLVAGYVAARIASRPARDTPRPAAPTAGPSRERPATLTPTLGATRPPALPPSPPSALADASTRASANATPSTRSATPRPRAGTTVARPVPARPHVDPLTNLPILRSH